MNCCGVFDKNEWPTYFPNHNFTADNMYSEYPESCCRRYPEFSHCYGCLNSLSILVKESSVMLGTGALCIAFVQVISDNY